MVLPVVPFENPNNNDVFLLSKNVTNVSDGMFHGEKFLTFHKVKYGNEHLNFFYDFYHENVPMFLPSKIFVPMKVPTENGVVMRLFLPFLYVSTEKKQMYKNFNGEKIFKKIFNLLFYYFVVLSFSFLINIYFFIGTVGTIGTHTQKVRDYAGLWIFQIGTSIGTQ